MIQKRFDSGFPLIFLFVSLLLGCQFMTSPSVQAKAIDSFTVKPVLSTDRSVTTQTASALTTTVTATTTQPGEPSSTLTAFPDLSTAVLTLRDLPLGFTEVSAAELDLTGNDQLGDLGIESVFAFQNLAPVEMIAGITALLPTELEQALFDGMLARPEAFFQLLSQNEGDPAIIKEEAHIDTASIGDQAAGVSALFTQPDMPTLQMDIIGFRRGHAAALIFVAYFPGEAPVLSVGEVAQRLDQRIMTAPVTSRLPPTAAPLAARPLPQPGAFSDTTLASLPTATVKVAKLNVRRGPGLNYPVETTVTAGEQVQIRSQFENCSWLQVITADGAEGWVAGTAAFVTYTVTCDEITQLAARPLTGMVLWQGEALTGHGVLNIENQTHLDAVVVMMQADAQPVVAFYLRGKESFTLTGIHDGRYQLFYTTGRQFAIEQKGFSEHVTYRRFDREYEYKTTLFRITTLRAVIRPTNGGTSGLSVEEFPQLSISQ